MEFNAVISDLQQYKRKRIDPVINNVLALTKHFCSSTSSINFLKVAC